MYRSQKIAIAIIFATVLLINCSQATHQARTCYSCEGINCQRTSLMEEQTCVNALDYCVTIYDNSRVVKKGCSLEVPIELRRHCDANSVECHKCYSDRCNNLGQRNYLCLECDSNKDSNCSKNVSAVKPSRCPSPSAPNSYCFVKYDGSATIRGCATNVADQLNCWSDASCMLCLPGDLKGCNNVDFAEEGC